MTRCVGPNDDGAKRLVARGCARFKPASCLVEKSMCLLSDRVCVEFAMRSWCPVSWHGPSRAIFRFHVGFEGRITSGRRASGGASSEKVLTLVLIALSAPDHPCFPSHELRSTERNDTSMASWLSSISAHNGKGNGGA